MAQYLLFPVDHGSFAQRVRNAFVLLAIAISLTHLIMFSAYFNGGTAYYDMTALVLDGTVTPAGYALSALHGLSPALVLLLWTWRNEPQ